MAEAIIGWGSWEGNEKRNKISFNGNCRDSRQIWGSKSDKMMAKMQLGSAEHG